MIQQQVILKVEARKRLLIPHAPVMAMDGHKLYCLTSDGEITRLSIEDAHLLARSQMPIVCNAPQMAARLNMKRFIAYDVLELFAFVHPGVFCVPTPRGIARALNLLEPETGEDQCLSLRDAIRHLLTDLTAPAREEKSDPAAIAAMMGLKGNVNLEQGGWPWADTILAALDRDTPPSQEDIRASLRIWNKLPEWSVHAPEPSPGHEGVSAEETAARLHRLLAHQHKEERPEQHAYAQALTEAFAPLEEEGQTHVVLAEAGTGVGKTLGYLAPATLWAEKNGGAVWISTFTRNLQRQVEAELDRLYDDKVEKARKVVTRKGRENYLCLLNLEDIAQSGSITTNDQNATALGLMLRWAAMTQDGDMAGKDFPGWVAGLIGRTRLNAFADRRGECIYSACPHFDRCFIEKSTRKAKRADIVIANHALVMHQIAMNGEDGQLPGRYIFDEGHHLFEAADGAFDFQLNGTQAADLRRWLLGSEAGGRSRARGLKRRLEELIAGDDDAMRDLESAIEAARSLPAPGWRERLWTDAPKGTAETFLRLCHQQVSARNKAQSAYYSLETPLHPPIPGLAEAADDLRRQLAELRTPIASLIRRLQKKLEDEAAELDTQSRERIMFAISSLTFRANNIVGGWMDMLESLSRPIPEGCVDWLEITRIDGHDFDTGFYRCYVDPAKIFSERLKPHAHGVVVTSATLRDPSEEDREGWKSALARTGVQTMTPAPTLFYVSSPFDYKNHTKVLVVEGVQKDDPAQVASAYRELFLAAGGGALGIFTAVQRLKAVHEKLQDPLEEAGLNLYAQHIDPLDASTLIDIFREEENACLLGTDATRDGIDIPGRSLRLVVYDRVPWPRPTILHKARREHFGREYDDMLTRFKLKQAYGRLIRRADDRGVFVILDSALPSRLLSAFPEGMTIERIGLKEAIGMTRKFLAEE